MDISIENLTFNLLPEANREGGKLFSLQGPFKMFNGASFDTFVEEDGNDIRIFDDGLTMHEIVSSGIDMSSPDRWSELREIASRWNVTLSSSGVFELTSSRNEAETAVENFFRALFAIDDWIREKI